MKALLFITLFFIPLFYAQQYQTEFDNNDDVLVPRSIAARYLCKIEKTNLLWNDSIFCCCCCSFQLVYPFDDIRIQYLSTVHHYHPMIVFLNNVVNVSIGKISHSMRPISIRKPKSSDSISLIEPCWCCLIEIEINNKI